MLKDDMMDQRYPDRVAGSAELFRTLISGRSIAILAFALSLGSVTASCTQQEPSFDRPAAVAKIDAALRDHEAFLAELRRLKDDRGASSRYMNSEAVNKTRANLHALARDAARVIEENPRDAAALRAMRLVLAAEHPQNKSTDPKTLDLSWDENSAGYKSHLRVADLLASEHVDADIIPLLDVVSLNPPDALTVFRKVYERTRAPGTRAFASAALLSHLSNTLNDAATAPAQRDAAKLETAALVDELRGELASLERPASRYIPTRGTENLGATKAPVGSTQGYGTPACQSEAIHIYVSRAHCDIE